MYCDLSFSYFFMRMKNKKKSNDFYSEKGSVSNSKNVANIFIRSRSTMENQIVDGNFIESFGLVQSSSDAKWEISLPTMINNFQQQYANCYHIFVLLLVSIFISSALSIHAFAQFLHFQLKN